MTSSRVLIWGSFWRGGGSDNKLMIIFHSVSWSYSGGISVFAGISSWRILRGSDPIAIWRCTHEMGPNFKQKWPKLVSLTFFLKKRTKCQWKITMPYLSLLKNMKNCKSEGFFNSTPKMYKHEICLLCSSEPISYLLMLLPQSKSLFLTIRGTCLLSMFWMLFFT